MSRLSLPRLLLLGSAALLLALLLLWLLPDRQGLRRHQWTPPAVATPDLSAYTVAMERRPPLAAAAAISRPLFTPDRRPPAPAAAASEPPAAPPPPPPPDELDKTRLLGVMTGRGLAGVIAAVDGETRIVRQGQAIGAWRLAAIDDRAVTFVREGERRTLHLEYALLPAEDDARPPAAAASAAPPSATPMPPARVPPRRLPPAPRRPAR